jgi:hypothetical protein
MNRPSFQFYPGDWRGNANLRRCSLSARGAWVDIMCVLHDSDEYGVVRWPLDELAQAAGITLELVQELYRKQVLKGSDTGMDAFTHTTRHAGQTGDTHTLIPATKEPCWYSSRMVRDEWLRNQRGGNTRFSSEKQPTRSPIARVGERVGDGASSSSSSSISPPRVEAVKKSVKNPNHEAFIKGWVENYKSKFGVDYQFDGGRDGKAVKQLLSMGILLIDLLEIAKKAWNMPAVSFACRQARTINGFHHQFNPIQTEVRNGSSRQAAAAGRPAGGNF